MPQAADWEIPRGAVMARMFGVNKKNYQKLEAIGKKKGGLKPTQ
jgi:hypothetical protein